MRPFTDTFAPGWPGGEPRWNSSAKSGVGTARTMNSQVWFTTSHGILNEVYYPRVDYACIRDMGFLVADGKEFFSEEKRHTRNELEYLAPGVPAYRMTNTCLEGRYRITKEILTDPHRDTLLQHVTFEALQGSLSDYKLYALLASHIMNAGQGNTAWCGLYKGMPMVFSHRDGAAIAMACSMPFSATSVGFVGVSDAWQDISQHKAMTWCFERAENGNVALCGEIDLEHCKEASFVLAIGFGMNAFEAGQRALSSILDGYDVARDNYLHQWRSWQEGLLELPFGNDRQEALYRISAATILSHEAPQFPGGFIASLAVPWGFSKGDDDLGGYHLVWPRDLVESAGGLLAAGAQADARRVLSYLQVSQEPDGHWMQNMWLDGSPYWSGLQMDETAFPVLLINMLLRHGALKWSEIGRYMPMIHKAVRFVVQNGPYSPQDRWEENGGYSPFTLAVEIAALLGAADIYEETGSPAIAQYLRETADAWNENIEAWTYVRGTELADELGIEGYYVRIAPPEVDQTPSLDDDVILIKNLPGASRMKSAQIVSPDALALVRFGLRAADDPRMLNTIKAIDALLKVETPFGDCWHRYNHDGYGEHADGSPFDGTGIGRAWPLLTGERAHYELAAGNFERARQLLDTLSHFANEGGMIPEQVWDSDDIPERELFFGRPAGSAMPLVWAHGEYIKLCRSLHDEEVFDMPVQTRERYLHKKQRSTIDFWRFNRRLSRISRDRRLRIEVLAPCTVHVSTDGWKTTQDLESRDTGLGVHMVDIDLQSLQPGTDVVFTFLWTGDHRWEGEDFHVQVEA